MFAIFHLPIDHNVNYQSFFLNLNFQTSYKELLWALSQARLRKSLVEDES